MRVITGIVVKPGRLFAVVCGPQGTATGGVCYKINLEDGNVSKVQDGLSYPQGLLLLRMIGSTSMGCGPVPDGFEWVRVGAMRNKKMGLLKPEEWFYKVTKKSNKELHVVSLEDSRSTGAVGTGLTLTILNGARKKKNRASEYTTEFIKSTCDENEVILDMFSEPTTGPFKSCGCRVRSHKGASSKIIHFLALANDLTGTMFLYQFEAPEECWDTAWETGEVLMRKIWVNDKI